MNARASFVLGAVIASFAACTGPTADAGSDLPPLPPLVLAPFQPELTRIAQTLPKVPEATAHELRELGDVALQIVEADARTLDRAERALLEHPFAWSVLEPAMADDQPLALRCRAAWLCGRSQQSILILPLLLRLKYELDPEGVLWVADALQRLGNDAGLAFLDGAMGVEKTAERAGGMAIEICRERGLTLGEQPTYVELRTRMRELLAQWRERGTSSRPGITPPPDDQLQARLAVHLSTTQGTQLRPVDDARFVMTRAGTLVLPLLMRACAAEERYLRTMALQVLADLGPTARTAEPAVLPLLADPFTGSYAIRTLGEIGARTAIPHLRARLASNDTEVRAAAPGALGLLGDRTSAPLLQKTMNDANEVLDVRVNAAFGLLCLGPDPAAEAFLTERDTKKDFHADMLAHLRERLAAVRH